MLSDFALVSLGFIAIVGLCFGSFYNVVILRGLSGESIAFPGSKCPKCEKPLKWYHNIPLISYLFLGGKCAFCKTKISIQYPLVELITAILFVISYLKWGITLKALFMVAIISMLLITIVTDLRERVILTQHSYILCGIGLSMSLIASFAPQLIGLNTTQLYIVKYPIVSSVLGGIIGVVVMESLARLGYLIAGKRAFGEGDSYIAGALGAVFGVKYILFILLLGGIIQFIFSLPLFLINTVRQGQKFVAIEMMLFLLLAVLMWIFSVQLDTIIYMSGLILLIFMALHLIKKIVAGMKNQNNQTYLPFVPAMNLAAGIVLFILL